ncbi:MAG: CHAT domain-containing protein [Phycisphaerae bacterium]|nr:CHAT domain-containing protein [Saprospiraceae bacterium]
MKKLFFALIFFVLLPGVGLGQAAVDSALVVKEVDSLIQLCRTLTGRQKFEESLRVIDVAKKKAFEAFGEESVGYVNCISNRGRVYHIWGKLDEAEPLYLETKTRQEKILGKAHLDYAITLNNLGRLYYSKGKYEKAEQLYLEAKSIREKALGKEHPSYASILSNLASIYLAKGEYEKSEQLYLEAKTIQKKALTKEPLSYAITLNNLASIYQIKGDYDKSEQLYLETKNIREKVLGKDHSDYANCLYNLATLYRLKGELDKAEQAASEAKNIMERVFGKSSSDYATSAYGLAAVYRAKKEYDKAKQLHLEAKNIREKILGKEHPDYIKSLTGLGIAYLSDGEYDKAGQIFLEAKGIGEKIFGKKHEIYAKVLENLADCYRSIGEYGRAEPLFLEAKNILEMVFGREHPDYAMTSFRLSHLYTLKNDVAHAVSTMLSSNSSAKSLLQKSTAYSSEKEMLQYSALFNKRFDALYKVAQTYQADSLIIAAYDNALFLNNALLFSAIARAKGISKADSSTRAIHAEWKSFHLQLAKQFTLPIAERDSNHIEQLKARANDHEKELARRSPDFVDSRRVVQWREVQSQLHAGEVGIEFVHYSDYDSKSSNSENPKYAALILRPGWSRPRMIHLFEQRQIQPLLTAANTAATAGQLYATRGGLRGHKTRARQKEEGIVIPSQKTANLYQLIWAPLDSLLSGVTTVYYAPSGLLHRLQLGAIAVPGTDQTLSDKYALVQLGSTRQLVVHGAATPTTTHTAALFGGLRYELENAAAMPDSAQQTNPLYDITALRSALGGRGGDAWSYLPGTEKEVKNVATTLGKAGYSVRTLSGQDGSEAAFKMLGKDGKSVPTVLHIATHGFFFPDPKDTTQQRGSFSDREPVFKTSDNPLLRSGLVLAGANPAWAGSKTPEGQEDGILTAYEISQMNLSGTELVVLSACETGLGDVEDNEGVYGLKRAFKIAGAKYLIMSLWQVPDKQTQELMSAFYKNWLARKMGIPKAFSAAQKTMRKRYGDPFFWAAFVLVE